MYIGPTRLGDSGTRLGSWAHMPPWTIMLNNPIKSFMTPYPYHKFITLAK
jgi:hypothetical protein